MHGNLSCSPGQFCSSVCACLCACMCVHAMVCRGQKTSLLFSHRLKQGPSHLVCCSVHEPTQARSFQEIFMSPPPTSPGISWEPWYCISKLHNRSQICMGSGGFHTICVFYPLSHRVGIFSVVMAWNSSREKGKNCMEWCLGAGKSFQNDSNILKLNTLEIS